MQFHWYDTKYVVWCKKGFSLNKILHDKTEKLFIFRLFIFFFVGGKEVGKIEYLTLNLRYNIWAFNRRLDDNHKPIFEHRYSWLCLVCIMSQKKKSNYIIIIHFTSVCVCVARAFKCCSGIFSFPTILQLCCHIVWGILKQYIIMLLVDKCFYGLENWEEEKFRFCVASRTKCFFIGKDCELLQNVGTKNQFLPTKNFNQNNF